MMMTGWRCDSCGTVAVADRVPSDCSGCDYPDFPTHDGEDCRTAVFVQSARETIREDTFPSLGWVVAMLRRRIF